MVASVTSQSFEQDVLKSSVPVVVDVFATWCGPCRSMMPIIEELSTELVDKCKFVKLNIDEERDLAIQHRVSSIPTFLFVKAGKIVGKETGAMGKDALKVRIESYFG